MINLETGTNSVWLSLRESLPVGLTPSYFNITFTNDMRGETYSYTGLDLTPNGKWSSFNIIVGSATASLNLVPGQYSYLVTASGSSVSLETGKAVLIENITQVVYARPAKETKALKR